MVKVRVGGGPAVPVILDTGSTGLHIYAPAVRLGPQSGVALTDHADTATYFDGTVQRGVVGNAKITIGGMRTTRRVPFGYVRTVSCVGGAARCPSAGGIASYVHRGIYGILGIGLTRSREGLGNPLLALRKPYDRTWSIALHGSHGTLTLGPQIADRPLAQFHLKRDGSDPGGARAWKDQDTRVCWAAVGLRGSGCEPTVFDTGSFTMFWYGGLLSHATTYYGSILVSPGTYIAAWPPGREHPFWSFTAGQDFSRNTVLAFHGGHPLVIAAVQAFLTFKIVYDDTRGRILLYRRRAS